jgi:hypothetical protein
VRPGREFKPPFAPESARIFRSKREPNVDAAMLGAGVIPIFRGCKEAVVAAGRGLWMIVPVALNLVIIILVIIPMNVGLHDLMIIWLAIVRVILRADQRWGHCSQRESR